MTLIYVRAKPDRTAYYEGRVIPKDNFIPVTDTAYIRRLVNHWGDLEVEENPGRSASSKTLRGRNRETTDYKTNKEDKSE